MTATMTMFVLFSSLRLESNQFGQNIDVKSLHHRREINKKTRSGDKKLRKQLKLAKKVGSPKLFPSHINNIYLKEKI